MHHFIVEVTYTASLEAIDEALVEHRAFLQTGYDAGRLLFSGPQNPRTGGVIVGRAASRADFEDFLQHDPFRRLNLADYRIIEVEPVKRQPFLESWVQGE